MPAKIKNIQTSSSMVTHRRRSQPAALTEGIKITLTEVDMLGGSLKRTKRRGRPSHPVDLMDLSNPKSRRITLDYIGTAMSTDRTFTSTAPLTDSSIPLGATQEKTCTKDDKNSSMQRLIDVLKASQRLKSPEMELILLDTSYINSIVAENESVKRVITKLHETLNKKTNGNFEIILTKGVYDELDRQLKGSSGPKKDEFGRPIVTSFAMDELRKLIYGDTDGSKTLISLENYESDENSRQELSVVLKKRNKKGNSRVGAGDTSIIKCIKHFLGEAMDAVDVAFSIITGDSDLKKIMRGCGIVRVLTGKCFKERKVYA